MEGAPLCYVRTVPEARIDRPRPGDVGYDIYSVEPIVAPACERKPKVGNTKNRRVIKVRTGIKIACPEGYYARVAPRSSLALKGVSVEAGVIDPSYRGEIVVVLRVPYGFNKPAGTKIAQIIIEKCAVPALCEVESLDETARGAGGFGSTDITTTDATTTA